MTEYTAHFDNDTVTTFEFDEFDSDVTVEKMLNAAVATNPSSPLVTIKDSEGVVIYDVLDGPKGFLSGFRKSQTPQNAMIRQDVLIESLRRELSRVSQERDNLRDKLSQRDKTIDGLNRSRDSLLDTVSLLNQERDNLRDSVGAELSRKVVAERDMSRAEADMLRVERDNLADMSRAAVSHLRDTPPNVEAALILMAP